MKTTENLQMLDRFESSSFEIDGFLGTCPTHANGA
jgi:hypothetical protein